MSFLIQCLKLNMVVDQHKQKGKKAGTRKQISRTATATFYTGWMGGNSNGLETSPAHANTP